jgi:CHAT domain-containing protein
MSPCQEGLLLSPTVPPAALESASVFRQSSNATWSHPYVWAAFQL